MSEIRVNKVIDEAGTGAVELTQGATLPAGKTITGSGSINLSGAVTATALTGTPTITVQDATVQGNLTVNGTTTTINTATLQVQDATIDTRHGNSVVAGTGGLRVIQTTDGSGNVTASREIRYNHSTGKWEFTEDGSTFKNLGSGGMGFSYFCGSF
jgi:hypothetical protein